MKSVTTGLLGKFRTEKKTFNVWKLSCLHIKGPFACVSKLGRCTVNLAPVNTVSENQPEAVNKLHINLLKIILAPFSLRGQWF